MLKFNSFRAQRYLRTKYVEGKFLLASEASDMQLETIDLMRKSISSSIGDVAIGDGWKVVPVSGNPNQLLIKPGEAWYKGLPYIMQTGADHLVSGDSLTPGILPSAVSITDDPNGEGKLITFNDGGATPTGEYRIVITAREELVTNVDDPFLKNANLTENTAQKIRLTFKIDIVEESLQDSSPLPYTNDVAGKNLVNEIQITPAAAGNGELISITAVPGSEEIDGRDIELLIRNNPAIGSGNPIPNGTTDQNVFFNGTLVDSNGTEYHVNAIFNDVVSTQVIVRIDKEVGQPNPVITNGVPYKLVKRDVFATDDVNGNPLGKLFYPIATVDFNSANGIVHESKIADLRTSVASTKNFQHITNQKLDLNVTCGGDISHSSSDYLLTWSQDIEIVNPHGPKLLVPATSDVPMLEGGSLSYELDLASGGDISRGALAVNVTAAGASITVDPVSLEDVRVGNVLKVGAEIVEITAINDVSNSLSVSPALVGTGAGTIYMDSFGPEKAPLSETSYTLAVRNCDKFYVAGQVELEQGEISQIGDGISSQLLTFMGATSEVDDSPNYSSENFISDGDSLVSAIGSLDAELNSVTVKANEDRSIKLVSGGTWLWSSGTLSWSSDAYIDLAGQLRTLNTISAGSIALASDGEVAYVEINRTGVAPLLLTVQTAQIDALVQTDNTVIIARRVGTDILVGTGTMLLKDGERLELDGALAEINRYFGQLRLEEHPSNKKRIVVTGADVTKLDGSVLSQTTSNLLLKFSGAQIDFSTGEVFEDDGLTPLGINFTPTVLPASEYFYYSITLVPSSVNADNTIGGQLVVLSASASNAVAASAPKAAFANGLQLGQVRVQESAGTIADISQSDLIQLGVGGGSGSGGSGNADSFTTEVKDRFVNSYFEFVTPYVFSQLEDSLIDVTSTGTFSLADGTYLLDSAEIMLSENMFGARFMEGDDESLSKEIHVLFGEGGLDEAATFELALDGSNFDALSLSRIGQSSKYYGRHVFSQPANATMYEYAVGNADGAQELDDTSNQAYAVPFSVAAGDKKSIREVLTYLNKVGSPSGSISIKIVADDTGTPTGDVITYSSQILAANIASGDSTVTFDGFKSILPEGDYWLVIEATDAYRASFVTGVEAISVRTDSGGTPDYSYDGATWSVLGTGQLTYQMNGHIYDLRLRITASDNNKSIEAFAIFYDETVSGIISGERNRQVIVVSGDDNITDFSVTNFLPDLESLTIYHVEGKDVYKYPFFRLDGSSVIFPADTFNLPGETVTLIFDQSIGSGFDNSDSNRALLAAMGAGSLDDNIDLSQPGLGPILRDEVTGDRYRIKIVSGVVTPENIE